MDIQMRIGGEMAERPASILRLDMHVHSTCSHDSVVPVESIVRAWRRSGVLSLVCDHDTIVGSQRVMAAIRALSPDIPWMLAEEITSDCGEIIGLFLSEEIPPGRSPDETLDLIKDQGGLSLIPHPFCRYRTKALHYRALESLLSRIDIIEGFNARTVADADNERALDFAKRHQ